MRKRDIVVEFKRCFRKWQAVFAPEWRVVFQVVKGTETHALAEVDCPRKPDACVVATIYPDNINRDLDTISIDESAFHEVMHLVLGRWHYETGYWLSKHIIEDLTHDIIRRWENYVFGYKRGGPKWEPKSKCHR